MHTHSLLYKGSRLELAETEILVLERPGLEGGARWVRPAVPKQATRRKRHSYVEKCTTAECGCLVAVPRCAPPPRRGGERQGAFLSACQ